MSMIQLRNVPEDLHRQLKSRAAKAGMSLSDYLIGEIRQVAERSTLEEMLARLKSQPPVELDISPADVIRAERDGLADSL
jgi:plasmid stability protein